MGSLREGVETLRKLSLIGVLAVAGQGSRSQIFIGLLLSVLSLCATIRLQPFKLAGDNHLKTAAEAATFLTMLAALMIKAGPQTGELTVGWFDAVLVLVFIVGLPAAFAATFVSKRDQMQDVLSLNTEHSSLIDQRRHAIQLFLLGVSSPAEMRLVSHYISNFDHHVNRHVQPLVCMCSCWHHVGHAFLLT